VALALTLVLSPTLARADDGPSDRDRTGFISLDRMDSTSNVGIDFGFTTYEAGGGRVSLLQGQLYGQWAPRGRFFGIYGMLPYTIATATNGGDTAKGVGNAEAGALLHHRSGTSELLARLGLTMPTSNDDALLNALGGYGRLEDALMAHGGGIVVRSSGSLINHQGPWLVRLDLGIAHLLGGPTSATPTPAFDRTVAYVSGGIGVRVKSTAFTAELVNVKALSHRMWNNLTLGASFYGDGRFHVALVLPLNDNTPSWTLIAGFQWKL
jgi:hypothetical protein